MGEKVSLKPSTGQTEHLRVNAIRDMQNLHEEAWHHPEGPGPGEPGGFFLRQEEGSTWQMQLVDVTWSRESQPGLFI